MISRVARISAGRHTRLIAADPAGVLEAAGILRAGGLVAFPTETVYGLGAHALDARAVRGIFEAKRRPTDDPLIVHLPQASEVETVALPNRASRRLGERFWPGPLTLVLPRRAIVPLEITAGLDTVAVRVPAHPTAHALLRAAGVPLAAPSANLFGRPSPTRAEHVLHDLDGRIDAVLDSGPTQLGVESTIVDVSGEQPRLLRPGGLAAEEIEAALGQTLGIPIHVAPGAQPAPGLMSVHYAPRTPLVLIAGRPDRARDRLREEIERATAADRRVGVLLLDEDVDLLPSTAHGEPVGSSAEPDRIAERLFAAVRALDRASLDVIFARELADPSVGLGRALADRVRRAAQRVVEVDD
jgi:L-threonylcarbamoyladenylate synthase